MEHTSTLVVVGGGAAGFFCAVNAARLNPSLKVIIIEKSGKTLSKVKVSGGGRCNLTHACFEISEMSSKYPRGSSFVKKTFHHFFTTDTISWFEERGVKLKKEPDGRMFPQSNSSQTIIDCLNREAQKYQVEILMYCELKSLKGSSGQWKIMIGGDRIIEANYICLACGGYPKAAMFDWLKNLGHTILAPVPSLFTFNLPTNPIITLPGVSVPEAQIKITGSKLLERGPLLITHWGFSGPAILRLSAWGARELALKNYDFVIGVNWIPEYTTGSLRESMQIIRSEEGSKPVFAKNIFGLPQRLWEHLCSHADVGASMRWGELPGKTQNKLIQQLTDFECRVNGKTTFKEEFVTAGGIALSEIDFNTMQSKILPGVFFAGELMDVDGITGGFNFQHAWTSGFIAAKSISERSR
jgi:predicted Rossmann fold flavoprotein